jgi:hypothetical protein
MSPRNTAHPPRTATARPGKSVRSSLIVKDKKKKRSAQDQSALDDRFHRTLCGSAAAGRSQNVQERVSDGGPQSAGTDS